MGDKETWVKDIGDVRSLGSRDMTNVAKDVQATLDRTRKLEMDGSAFGDNHDMQTKMLNAYGNVKTVLTDQVGAAQKGMSDSAAAIVKVADHYRELEMRMSR